MEAPFHSFGIYNTLFEFLETFSSFVDGLIKIQKNNFTCFALNQWEFIGVLMK